MILHAFVDPDGCVIRGGVARTLPVGALAVPAPFTAGDLPRLMLRDGGWAERPALPRAVATAGGFRIAGLPAAAQVVLADTGTGAETNLDRAGQAEIEYALPADGEWEVRVIAPRPWLPSTFELRRGAGSAETATLQIAAVRRGAKEHAVAMLGRAAKAKIGEPVSPEEMASWGVKAAAARAWLSGPVPGALATEAQRTILEAEAARLTVRKGTVVTPDQVAIRVRAKADIFETWIAGASADRSLAFDAIDAATGSEEIAAALAALAAAFAG